MQNIEKVLAVMALEFDKIQGSINTIVDCILKDADAKKYQGDPFEAYLGWKYTKRKANGKNYYWHAYKKIKKNWKIYPYLYRNYFRKSRTKNRSLSKKIFS